eukprot:6475541-Amphidinium_carterae.1
MELCGAIPALEGGAKRAKRAAQSTSIATALLERGSDKHLHMHDDELTHTMDIPSVQVMAGSASITTINVTSLRQYWEAVVALQSDVICITEVRLSGDQQAIMADRMSAAGYTVIWGAPPPTKLNKRDHEYLTCGGVAIAVRSHWTAVELSPSSDDARALHQQGRFVSADIVSPGQAQRIQVHALYVTADPKLRDEQ